MTCDVIPEQHRNEWSLWLRDSSDIREWRLKALGDREVCLSLGHQLKKKLEWVLLPPGEHPIVFKVRR